MKTVLVIAATLSLSASAALADCAWHSKVSAQTKIDRTITTASVVTTEKQDRLPAATDPLILNDQKDGAVKE